MVQIISESIHFVYSPVVVTCNIFHCLADMSVTFLQQLNTAGHISRANESLLNNFILALQYSVATQCDYEQTFTINTELPTLPDSVEDFLIFRENKPIWVHKFDNLPDSGNILSIELYVILKIFLIGE